MLPVPDEGHWMINAYQIVQIIPELLTFIEKPTTHFYSEHGKTTGHLPADGATTCKFTMPDLPRNSTLKTRIMFRKSRKISGKPRIKTTELT